MTHNPSNRRSNLRTSHVPQRPSQGRTIVNMQQEPKHVQLGRVTKRYAHFCFKSVFLLLAICTVILGLAYAWVSQSPVSLTFLVKPLEDSIQRELGPLKIKMSDAVVQKAEKGLGIVFRLKNIRVYDQQGQGVAQAPSAAIGLSMWGLLTGKITPASVHLIGPELLLLHSKQEGFRVAFSKTPGQTSQKPLQEPIPSEENKTEGFTKQLGQMLETAQERQFNIAQTLLGFIKDAREGKTATSYLSQFGIRDALVYLKSENKVSEFKVPNIEMNLEHNDAKSIVSGKLSLASSHGPSDVLFRTELHQNVKQLVVWLQLNNFLPSALADKLPDSDSLKGFSTPITGISRFDLSREGDLLYSETKLSLGSGQLNFHANSENPLLIKKGNFHLLYEASKGHIEVRDSSIYWGNSYAVFNGGLKSGVDREGVKFWRFLLETKDAAVSTPEFNLPSRKITNWTTNGFIIPEQKRIHLNQFQVQLGNETINLSGDVIDMPGSPEVHIDGTFSRMSIETFKQIWPSSLIAGAREWIGERVSKGVIASGRIKASIPGGLLSKADKQEANIPDTALSFVLDLEDLETHYLPGLPPLKAKAAKAHLLGQKFKLTAPQAQVDLPSGLSVKLSNSSFTIPDLRKPTPMGHISLNTAGNARNVLEFLDHKPLEYLKEADMTPDMIKGETTAQMKMSFPLVKDLKFSAFKMDGKVLLEKAEFPGLVKDMAVKDGKITFGITQKAINASGLIQINGVPARIAWQRIFRADINKQPGVRIDASLNSKKLEKLGLPVSHMIRGDFETTLTMRTSDTGKKKLQLQANLTNAELILGNIGWSKPPAKRAILEFDIDQQTSGETHLNNFKIVGDDVAISGNMKLNADGKLNEFSFPDFSVDVITKLNIQGKKDERKKWFITVNGSAYDGRQFFRSIFSTGQVVKNQPTAREKINVEVQLKIGTILGYSNAKINDVNLYMKKTDGVLSAFEANGKFENGKILIAKLKYDTNQSRILRAETNNSGHAFKLIGFYPNIEGGQAALEVNLDGTDKKEQYGTLWARDFELLGDEVVQEVLSGTSDDTGFGIVNAERQRRGITNANRERILFKEMKVPFSIGKGQFVLYDSFINGPSMGATLRGSVDFEKKKLNLGGTYIPLYALNTALKGVPILGQLFFDKGVLGITFGIQGSMDNPQVLVNPASVVAPGIFREIFQFQNGSNQNEVDSKNTPFTEN